MDGSHYDQFKLSASPAYSISLPKVGQWENRGLDRTHIEFLSFPGVHWRTPGEHAAPCRTRIDGIWL